MEAQLDPIFEDRVESTRVPGAAAVALDRDGTVIFNKGYGNVVAGDETSPKVTPSTPAMIASCTKLVTCVVMLQLIEQGKANIMDPAEMYYPAITDIKLLKGWSDGGSPILVDKEKTILLLHLFTHTSGMAYDCFDADTLRWRVHKEQRPLSYNTLDHYMSPLVFEPGTRWKYGTNIDFLGLIVEKLSGMRLDQYIDKHIIQSLGLKNTSVDLDDEQSKSFFTVHLKDAEGRLAPTPIRSVQIPGVPSGDHYLYSSAEDYANFLLALLNNGTHPKSGVQILRAETVKDYIWTDMLPKVGCSGKGVGVITTTISAVSCTGTIMPGVDKGWSLGGLINNQDTPNGRKKGSVAWAGLGNQYFWVDPTAGKLGIVVSAFMPFFDKDVLHLADALERAVYGKPMANEIGEEGSNFEGGAYKVDA